MNYITKIIDQHGLLPTAKACDVSYQAVRKWEAAGRLPRTEYSGETNYADKLSDLSGGSVTRDQLLGMIKQSA